LAAGQDRLPELKGNTIHTYVILRAGVAGNDKLVEALREHLAHEMGPIAKPESITFVDSLPKTRSGKIVRRVPLAGAPFPFVRMLISVKATFNAGGIRRALVVEQHSLLQVRSRGRRNAIIIDPGLVGIKRRSHP
jgi:hypothetical protein